MPLHFCGCVFLRAVVFLAALATALCAGAIAANMWRVLRDIEQNAGDSNSSAVLTTTGAGRIFMFAAALVALGGLAGALGALFRLRRLVRAYAKLVFLVFLLSSPSLGVFLVCVFAGIPFYRGCAPADATAPGGRCRFAFTAGQKYAVGALAVAGECFLAYVTIAVWVYKAQLYGEVDGGDGDRVAKGVRASTDGSEAPYDPPSIGEEKDSLLAHRAPYSDARTSSGDIALV